MNKYAKLIKGLRCDGGETPEEGDGLGCANKKCKYRDVDGACDLVSMTLDAAAAITALQSENAELREENGCLRHNVAAMQATLDQQSKNCEVMLAEKDKEIERLEAKAKQWKQTSEENFLSCEKLQAALSRVEAERDVAVADIEQMAVSLPVCMDCQFCAHGTEGMECDECDDCYNFVWRGAQGEG